LHPSHTGGPNWPLSTWRAIGAIIDRKEPCHSLHRHVMRRMMCKIAGLAEGGNRTIHDTRIARRNCGIVKTETVYNARPKTFNEHIGLLN
jgi:hypothetical protein